ncbi:hypothetical protein P4C99_15020 [Pontiellaceae bacterium B1224]|nr:hypothetical protein [Pontiellaceae bacterium B1224]
MKKVLKLILIILCLIAGVFFSLEIVSEIISKPLLVESKESIKAYSGDGSAKYISAPDFGIDGVSITMPEFNMVAGLNAEYSLSNIPYGDPYTIFLVTEPLSIEKNESLIEMILEGNWSYTIKRNETPIKTISGSLQKMTNSSGIRWVKTESGTEEPLRINQFYSYSYGEENGLVVPDTKDNWSLSVTFTNAALTEPIHAYIYLRRGGSK